MAQQELQNILEGLKIHQQKVNQQQDNLIRQQQVGAENQRIADEKANRDAQLQETHRQFDEGLKVQNAHLDLAKQAANVATMVAKRETANAIARGESPGAPDTITPGSGYSGGGSVQFNGAGVNGQQVVPPSTTPTNFTPDTSLYQNHVLDLGNGQTLNLGQLPNPDVQNAIDARRKAALQTPDIALEQAKSDINEGAHIREAAAGAKDQFGYQTLLNAQRAASEAALKKQELEVEERIANNREGMQYKINMIPYDVIKTMDPIIKQQITAPAINGWEHVTLSGKQVDDEYKGKQMAPVANALSMSYLANGGVKPNEEQVKFTQGMVPIAKAGFPIIAQFINSLPDTPSTTVGSLKAIGYGIGHPLSLNPNMDSKLQQIHSDIATVAKNLSGDASQRLQKALLEPAEGTYLPSQFKTKAANISNFGKMINTMESLVDSNLGGLSQVQRDNVKKDIGLTDAKRMLEALKAKVDPSTVIQQPNNTNQLPNTSAPKLTPAALQILQKFGIQN